MLIQHIGTDIETHAPGGIPNPYNGFSLVEGEVSLLIVSGGVYNFSS
jgi:hypothetical protein